MRISVSKMGAWQDIPCHPLTSPSSFPRIRQVNEVTLHRAVPVLVC